MKLILYFMCMLTSFVSYMSLINRFNSPMTKSHVGLAQTLCPALLGIIILGACLQLIYVLSWVHGQLAFLVIWVQKPFVTWASPQGRDSGATENGFELYHATRSHIGPKTTTMQQWSKMVWLHVNCYIRKVSIATSDKLLLRFTKKRCCML